MPMNPNFLCCIGAELKNSTQQTTRMTQVYLYRAFEDDTLSDMLSVGFFDEAIGVLRKDDLLLLYSPNETVAKWTYARVSNVDRDGITVERIGLEAVSVSVNTTGYSNISGNNLQEIIDSIDSEFSKYVKIDGSSIMTGPLKMRAGSMQGAIAAYWDGVGFFKLNSNDSVTLLASMEATDGLCPATNNTYNLGKTNYKWKDASIGRVITAIINNGYDIAVPVTNGPDTLALKSEVDTAANSGRMITDQGVWFAKMYAATVPPAADDGTNYADFSQTDGDGNPIIVIYERQSGAWVQSQTVTPPANYDGYVPVTKKIWDIVEQTGQNGGRILWNHQSKEFTPYPNIISFEDIEITGDSTVEMPLNPGVQQIVNVDYVNSQIAASAATKANVGMDNLTSAGKNIANWSSDVTNCITEIPQDIKLELTNGTLTLKAGSKVYVPNGSGVFNTLTIANDITASSWGGGTDDIMLFINGTSFTGIPATRCYSGSSQPTVSGGTDAYWYDTTNNVIKRTTDTGATWTTTTYSLPIAIFSRVSGTITAIKQVFNGFGYIGSTIFALPGVKVLVPDGRNADGSLKSTQGIVSAVKVISLNNGSHCLMLDRNGNFVSGNKFYYDVSLSALSGSDCVYLSDKNEVWRYGTGGLYMPYAALVLTTYLSGGAVTSFSTKFAFHAVDYNDSEYIANCAMPSNKYIDLTLGTSPFNVTAPADGYIVLAKNATTAGYEIRLKNQSNLLEVHDAAGKNNQDLAVTIPCSKGDVIRVYFSADGATSSFRFVYANGAAGQ